MTLELENSLSFSRVLEVLRHCLLGELLPFTAPLELYVLTQHRHQVPCDF